MSQNKSSSYGDESRRPVAGWGVFTLSSLYDGRPGFGKVSGVAVSVCCAGWICFLCCS
jgi:hypothetical protein